MSLTVTEAQAVVDLLDWLVGKPFGSPARKVTDAEAIEAMELLAEHAGRTLQTPPDLTQLSTIVERLRAADSDGAAQAVARALDEHKRHGGSIPWPTIQRGFDEWNRIQDRELGERLRDQTAGSIDTAWGAVDV